MNKKSIYALLVVMISALVLSGCTNTSDEVDSGLSGAEISVINDDDTMDEDTSDVDVEDLDTEEDETADTTTDVEIEDLDTEDEEDMDTDTSESYEGEQVYEGATASDTARVSTWEYETAGGVMSFMWTFSSSNTETPIGSYKVGYDDDMNIVVEFTSLGYASATDNEYELGSTLPDLSYEKTANGAIYRFMTGEESDFEMVRNGNVLTLKLDL